MTIESSWIPDVLSLPRFAPYLARTDGDVSQAIELYWWNVEVSAAFYSPLHCLEVALRNALHRQLAAGFRRTDWWTVAPLQKNGPTMVDDARRKLSARSRGRVADDMVAELSFGFWVSLTSSVYDRSLWVPFLHKAFLGYRGPRRRLHNELHTMLLFRNRIMHHEPIHYRHLDADHRTLVRALGYLSPGVVRQLGPRDRVDLVLRQRPGAAA